MEGTTTRSFSDGKALSAQLRAVTPAQMAEMAARLEHIHSNTKDYVAPGLSLSANVRSDGVVVITMSGKILDAQVSQDFEVGELAHDQISDKLGIPRKYYDRMRVDAPGLLKNNINYWLAHENDEYMLRVLDGRIRAVLSKRYRSLDSYDLFFHTYQTAKEANAVMAQMDLTERRLYMRLLQPDFAAKITGRGENLKSFFSSGYKHDNGTWQVADDDDPDGDWVFPMIVASDSDTGHGKLTVELGMLRTTCKNLILVGQKLHKIHLGAEREVGLQIADDTQAAKDKAVWLEVRDLVRAGFNEDEFKAMVKLASDSKSQVLEEPIEAVNTVAKHYGFSDEMRDAILNELVSPSYGGSPGATVWGLTQAVTAQAHKHEDDADGEYELARIGGELLTGKALELVKVRNGKGKK